jgi:hypothetical protein
LTNPFHWVATLKLRKIQVRPLGDVLHELISHVLFIVLGVLVPGVSLILVRRLIAAMWSLVSGIRLLLGWPCLYRTITQRSRSASSRKILLVQVGEFLFCYILTPESFYLEPFLL